MSSISDIKKIREKKREAIRSEGVNPYPAKTKRTHSINEAVSDFAELSQNKQKITLTGRILSIREHGGSTFLHFADGTGKIQAFLREDSLSQKQYRFFIDNFDIGDFIEIGGILFETKRGEKTIEASDFKMLSKSLLPLPEKWHGLTDIEERFRKRYLDLIMNPGVKKNFEERSKMIQIIREILNKDGFIEVETPVLQPIPGGAFAKPFKTHLNALELDLYLRVAPELYLKRLLVGGFEKIFEIGRCFRNEGVDVSHNPDFTMLELYWAYQNRDGLISFVEKVFIELLERIGKGKTIIYQTKEINFEIPWKKVSFRDLVKDNTDINIDEISDKDLMKKIKELGIKSEKEMPRYKMLDELYKETCRDKLIQPTFVIDYPSQMSPLAKTKEENLDYADRFQLIIGGIEIINAFSEQNDPKEQEDKFKEVKMAPERKDKDFIEALEYGMPPSAGLGIGLDRLAALLTDSHSLRDIILFPTMKPK
ncbi:MAG: lysine--tRNA ligase [Candidatus Parcubacteria bacterium]|nr:lysine--tRNA ligase [Candidatus Parcubacteria bacterium]